MKSYINKWPIWLSGEEINRIRNAAQGDFIGTVITAACLYLGMNTKSAAQITIYTAYGQAIENRTKKAFLHIPDEYRQLIIKAGIKPTDKDEKIIKCSKEEAKQAIENVFIRANIDKENAAERLKRTAAILHYYHKWTSEEDIKKWFSDELKKANGEIEKQAYYKIILTDEEEQSVIDKTLMNFSILVR